MKKFTKTLLSIIAVVSVVLTLCTSCANKPTWNTAEGEVIKDLSYGDGYRNKYDLYLPANESPKALMLFIHGGSWMAGEKQDMAWAAERYAKEGYITASINYTRLESDSLTYHPKYGKPCLQSMIEEIDNSIKAIKAKCKEMGCNIKQMSIGGYSAGGHLAMLYSTLYAKKSPIPIKFQISWVGPSDFNLLFPTMPHKASAVTEDHRARQFYADLEKFAYCLSGEQLPIDEITEDSFNKLKSDVSPIDLVTPDTPPAVLAYGGKDGLVNAVHGKNMAQKLDENNVANQLVIFPNSGHGLSEDPDYATTLQNVILEFCAKYFGDK